MTIKAFATEYFMIGIMTANLLSIRFDGIETDRVNMRVFFRFQDSLTGKVFRVRDAVEAQRALLILRLS